MSTIAAIKSWTTNEVLTASDLNATFSTIRTTVNTYGAFIDVANIFSAAQTFGALVTITTGGLTVTAGGATITAGGLVVTAGGLTVSASGAAITGNSSVAGTLTATTFSGSGASLTSIPQAGVTNLVSDLAAKAASVHVHAGTDITTGTVAEARLPTTFTALTITTLTSPTSVLGTIKSAASTPKTQLNLADSGTEFWTSLTTSPYVVNGGGGANPFNGALCPTGYSLFSAIRWIRGVHNGQPGFIPFVEFSP